MKFIFRKGEKLLEQNYMYFSFSFAIKTMKEHKKENIYVQ